MNAATVISASQQEELSLGIIDLGLSGGSINSAGNISGSIISMGGLSHGNFLVSGTNNNSGGSRRTFRVFLANSIISLNNNGQTINLRLSLRPDSNSTSLNFNFPNGSGLQTLSVEIYGSISVSPPKQQGSYSNSYIVTFCNCTSSGCPNSASDSRCL